jgi:hypothetical protein
MRGLTPMRAEVGIDEPRVTDPEVTDMPGPTRPSPGPSPSPSPRPTLGPETPPDAGEIGPEAPHDAGGHGLPPPPWAVDGPPPPPAGSGSEAESRATAAAWVAAVGATLLLAAAGTFLAVAWDGLGLTARVAVVASLTGAAILGGQRLRRVLPAVGAVVFHLGALLVPIDALGLAYQLDASVPARWAAVGLTASLALPLLAVVGRSRVLGLAGLAGLPIVATAAGLAGFAHPAVVLVALAALAASVELSTLGASDGDRHADPLDAARRIAAPGLASLAVMVPLVFATVARLAGTATVLGRASGGWVASSWVVPAGVGLVAVGVLAVTATRRNHAGIAGLALASAVVSVILTVLPPATPRTVLVLAPAVIWLLAELAALSGRDHALWQLPTRTVASILEVLALAGVVGAVLVLFVTAAWSGVRPDTALAAQSVTFAVAWLVAAARRGVAVRPGDAEPAPAGRRAVWLVAAAVAHLAVATLQLGGSEDLAGLVLLAAAVGSLGLLVAQGERSVLLTGAGARSAAAFVALALLWLSLGVLLDRDALALLLVAVPVVMGLHLRTSLRTEPGSPGTVVASVLALSVTLLGWVAYLVEDAGRWPAGAALLVGVAGLLGFASAVDRLEPAADSLRALAMVAGLFLLLPSWGSSLVRPGVSSSGLYWVYGLRVIPAAILPAVVIGTWLACDALRRRRMTILALAAPVLVRALAAGLLGAGVPIRATGTLLLGVAVGAACTAAVGPRILLGPVLSGGAFAGLVGWLLVGDSPTLRAALVVAAGLVVAGVGTSRRRPVVAHLGGALTTIGIWQLLDLSQITALDLWLLPVAVQLAVAGELARRRGTSSWVAFVPPLLLIAVPAIAERASGGPGWHAVLAGGIGVVAVVAGGAHRWGGPLIVGTVITVTVVLVETFAVVAAVPTWVWLAVGGLLLLGAAALIERLGGSPVTAVRRAIDVVGERFV